MGSCEQDLEDLKSHSSQASEDSEGSISSAVSPPRVIEGDNPAISFLDSVYEKIEEYLPLSLSISHGDLQGVKSFLDRQPDALTAWIDVNETPLLKACNCGQLEIVKELLQRMSPEQMLVPYGDQSGPPISPFMIAACNGNYEIVVALYEKNPNLLEPTHPDQSTLYIPVVWASIAGHREITRYLYDRTPWAVLMHMDGYWASWLLLDAIFYGFFDIALAIFDQDPSLAVIRHPRLQSPIFLLATKPKYFLRSSHLGFWRRLVYSFLELPTDHQTTSVNQSQRLLRMFLQCLPKWFGIQRIYELKKRDYEAKNFLHGVCRQMLSMVKYKNRIGLLRQTLFEAVKNGNKEFVVGIIKFIPHVLGNYDTSKKNVFHVAVEYRKENIFNLIYGLDERKIGLLHGEDIERNTILHTAGYLSDKEELAKVAGAALKMQREIQWFKEVESLIPERVRVHVNKKGMTGRQVFEDLIGSGFNPIFYCKCTANNCSIKGSNSTRTKSYTKDCNN